MECFLIFLSYLLIALSLSLSIFSIPSAKARPKGGCKLNAKSKKEAGFVSIIRPADESSLPKQTKPIAFQQSSAECCGSPNRLVEEGKSCEIVDSMHKYSLDHGNVFCDCPGNLLPESSNFVNYDKTEIDLVKDEAGTAPAEIDEIKVLKSEVTEEIDGVKEGFFDEEDDWEGIETSELESRFGSAVAYVGSQSTSKLSTDLKLKLYGLHKIAIEGPCHVPQPLPFKVSARAKWHAWQRLRNMKPEEAMEEYVNLLSTRVPGWIKDDSGESPSHAFE